MEISKLFTEYKIGPLTLRNRTIRSAAFESMCPGNKPSKALYDYHVSVAHGGVGMTTVAYALWRNTCRCMYRIQPVFAYICPRTPQG